MPSFRQNRRALIESQSGECRIERLADYAHDLAVRACRPKSEESFYPAAFIDLNHVITNQVHAPADAPDKERMRRIMAAGIPYQELAGVYSLNDGS